MCWNVRGLNSLATQFEVRKPNRKISVDLSLLETKTDQACKCPGDYFGDEWDSHNNALALENSLDPIYIWIFWKNELWTTQQLLTHSQLIHTHFSNSGRMKLFLNQRDHRRQLWAALQLISSPSPILSRKAYFKSSKPHFHHSHSKTPTASDMGDFRPRYPVLI